MIQFMIPLQIMIIMLQLHNIIGLIITEIQLNLKLVLYGTENIFHISSFMLYLLVIIITSSFMMKQVIRKVMGNNIAMQR